MLLVASLVKNSVPYRQAGASCPHLAGVIPAFLLPAQKYNSGAHCVGHLLETFSYLNVAHLTHTCGKDKSLILFMK